ncbi:MAG TPA: TMEM165/GDT1 family protein [Dehalococcoidia bacterium]|jgi:putative Ca2+/H+ antiporter (TMEM165/GDT1 family)|nr:TMEM165/GDT1 family protein [Dehalococcoidia bacterium]
MTALATAFGLVFVAELGDKSMLFAMVLASRYGVWKVLLALTVDTAVVMALAVIAGGAVDLLLTPTQLALLSGVLFTGFGVWTLRGADDREELDGPVRTSGLLIVATLAAALFVSELGDKTQIATLSLSGVNPAARFGVWAGATAGMVAADTLAIAVGQPLTRRVSERTLGRVAGAVFIAFGAGAIAFALW